MKRVVLVSLVIAAFFGIQCKDKEDLECGNFKVGEALLMPESKQLIEQYAKKKLIFKDSVGNKAIFYAQSISKLGDKNVLRVRCSGTNPWVDLGDYVDVDPLYITFDFGSPSSTFNRDLSYTVLTISEGLPPDTTHYDIAILGVNSFTAGTSSGIIAVCPLSKRGINSRKDLEMGNRYIGDTTLLHKSFDGVYKNFYTIYYNRLFTNLKSLDVRTTPVDDDIYFNPQKGIIAFKIKGDKLWVLDTIE